MNGLYHGARVMYDGFITTDTGETIKAIRYANVIGWDEVYIYTHFFLAKECSADCNYWNPDVILPEMVTKDYRLGFHISRLIKIIDDVKINIDHNLVQTQLFN